MIVIKIIQATIVIINMMNIKVLSQLTTTKNTIEEKKPIAEKLYALSNSKKVNSNSSELH